MMLADNTLLAAPGSAPGPLLLQTGSLAHHSGCSAVALMVNNGQAAAHPVTAACAGRPAPEACQRSAFRRLTAAAQRAQSQPQEVIEVDLRIR